MDDCVTKFNDLVKNLISKYIPQRIVRQPTCSAPVWHSLPLRKVLKEKRKYHKRWKLYGNPLDYQTFSTLRKRANKLELECYNNYISYSESKIKNHPNFFWSYVKSIFSKNRPPQSMHYKGITSSDGEQICNFFNYHFQSVFEKPSNLHLGDITNIPAPDCIIDLSTVEINYNIVLQYLKTVNVHKGAGPDGIHPLLIKSCSSTLATPVTILYTKSIKEGIVPKTWKQAWVTPIPKGSISSDVVNYRPISKLCIIGKLLEKIVTDQLFGVVRRHIIPNQHGFYKGRSVDSNLLTFTDEIYAAMDDGHSVDAIYTDFSKAFDKICHYTLLSKLWKLGIHGDLFRWIKSYVENRSQAVVLLGYQSQWMSVGSGVPQGSHLGPLLFTLYVNDITNHIQNSKLLLYADDTKIFRIVKNISDCEKLQDDLNNLVSYCEINNLFLNLDKCNVITFSKKKNVINYSYNLSGKTLNRVTEIRDLGVIMDSKLTFIPHIDKMLTKSYKQLGFIMRVGKPFKSRLTYKILYNSFVRSHLEFSCSVWKPFYKVHIDRIERLQKIFIKSLCFRTGLAYTADYTDTCKRLNIQTLSDRRDSTDSVLLFKIFHSQLEAPILLHKICFRVPRRRERCCRKRNLFFIPFSRTGYGGNVFIKRACKLFNENQKLNDLDIFNCSLTQLKNAFKY